MKIGCRGRLDVSTVVAVCCLAVIVVELASAAEESNNLFASENEDYETTVPSLDEELSDILTPHPSSLPQDKQSRPKPQIDEKREHGSQSNKYSAIVTTYRPKTATTSLVASANRQQDLKELSTKANVKHQGQVDNSAIVTTFRPKVPHGPSAKKDQPEASKEQNGVNRETSKPIVKTPSTVAERRQDHQDVHGTDADGNNLKPIKEKPAVQNESSIKTSSAFAIERPNIAGAQPGAVGNHLDQVAQSSAIISAFDSVAKGWTPISAPQSWKSLPQKIWLNRQQASAASANNQLQTSASVVGHHYPQQTMPGFWTATNSQQKPPIQAVIFMKKVPVPYPVTIEKEVPVKVAVPVNKPYPVYIPRPYHVFMEKKIPYRVTVPVPAPYAVETRIPVPVKVPVQKPYPVHIPAPYPVYVMRRVPYTVAKEVQVPVEVPVEKPYIVHVPVEKRVPYPVEKAVPIPVKIQVEKPVPVQVEKKVPVYIERRVPVYIQKLVPYPVKIPIRVPVPVPYYTQPPSSSNHHLNYFRPSPSFRQQQEPEGSHSSFHQVMVFPKKAPHKEEQMEQTDNLYGRQTNQQQDSDDASSGNYDENEDEGSDSGYHHGHYQAEQSQQPYEEEHYPEETGYNNYEADDEDYERQRSDEQYSLQGFSDSGDSYDEDDDYGEEKQESYTKVNMGRHEFSNSVNHQR